jgi:hypothetical protein
MEEWPPALGLGIGLTTLHRKNKLVTKIINRVLRKLFGPKRDEVTGENCITRSFVICTLRQV